MSVSTPSLVKSGYGYAVFNALLTRGGRGATKNELVSITGLTSTQVESGLNFIREDLQEANGEPIVYSPYREADGRQHVYRLAVTEQQAVDYIKRRARLCRKWWHNGVVNTTRAGKAKFANPLFESLNFEFTQAEDRIDFVIQQLEARP